MWICNRWATASVAWAAFVLLAAAGSQAAAASFDKLIGAWTMDGTDCAETFVMDGGHWRFKDRNSSLNTGLIVEGRAISGSYGTCKIRRILARNGTYAAILACESAVLFSEFTVHFRVVDDTHFARFDPDFPEVETIYQKCQP